MSREQTDKPCLVCEDNLEHIIAYDVGYYRCPNCGAQWDVEEYWHDSQEIEAGYYYDGYEEEDE